MLIFIDDRAPEVAKQRLSAMGNVVGFSTSGVCYDAISGHPDIFMFQYPGGLVVAPDMPAQYLNILDTAGVSYTLGKKTVGPKYPSTAHYNALFTSYGILHNSSISDEKVISIPGNHIFCRQGYVRCNTLQVGNYLITSDKGIQKALDKKSIPAIFINPENIYLPGFRNGFFGGCCGLWNNQVYICGGPRQLSWFDVFFEIIKHEGFEPVFLTDGPLMDIGGIFFIS